jgi:hypothetical protein
MHSVYNVSGGRAMGREKFFTVEGEVLKIGQECGRVGIEIHRREAGANL